MARANKWIVVAVALAFFAGPAVLVGVGERAAIIGNQGLAPRPQLAAHWAFFQQTTKYLTSHLPLRGQAVRVNSWVLENVFDTTPQYGTVASTSATGTLAGALVGVAAAGAAAPTGITPAEAFVAEETRVIRGRDGWLFYGFALDLACRKPLSGIRSLGRWEALLALLREYGRRAVFVVVPEKSTIYQGLVPSSDPSEACGRQASTALWRAIESATAVRDGIIGLLRPLLTLKAEAGGPIYIPLDTHWNGIGSLTFTRTVIPKLDRRLRLAPTDVASAPSIRRVGDLSAMEGSPETVVIPDRAVKRPPTSLRLGGVTFVLADSFLMLDRLGIAQFTPFLAESNIATWGTSILPFAAAMASSRTVVIETVEREVGIRGDLITPQFLQVLRADLRSAGDRRRRR